VQCDFICLYELHPCARAAQSFGCMDLSFGNMAAVLLGFPVAFVILTVLVRTVPPSAG